MFQQSNTASMEPPASSTMSQNEVEQLLASVGGSDALGTGPTGDAGGGDNLVLRHDFPLLTTCSPEEMRKLRLRCDSFVTALAARLSIHLRLECAVQMIKLDAMRFQAFAESLSTPTYLTLFRLDPLASTCLLDIPTRLALAVVDRELGGSASSPEESRDLTEIESKLADKVASVVLGEWCSTWSDVLPTRPVILRHENTGRFLNLCPPQTMFLVLALETHIGQMVETIQVAIPPSVQKPLLAKLNADLPGEEKNTSPERSNIPHWNPALNDLDLQVTARWQGLQISARQLADLKVGDVLPLHSGNPSQIELFVGSDAKFSGQLGTSGPQWAVKITNTGKA
jgi:flagellar motor switch protein FliM